MDPKSKEPLFTLGDGTPVFNGDILYHPDRQRVGWYCIAEFRQKEGLDTVTVRGDNGAVPTVLVSELKKEHLSNTVKGVASAGNFYRFPLDTIGKAWYSYL